jgi:hypothetical protein
MSAKRFAVKLRARRLAGLSMIIRCPCAGIVGIGLFGGIYSGKKNRNLWSSGFPVSARATVAK